MKTLILALTGTLFAQDVAKAPLFDAELKTAIAMAQRDFLVAQQQVEQHYTAPMNALIAKAAALCKTQGMTFDANIIDCVVPEKKGK